LLTIVKDCKDFSSFIHLAVEPGLDLAHS